MDGHGCATVKFQPSKCDGNLQNPQIHQFFDFAFKVKNTIRQKRERSPGDRILSGATQDYVILSLS